MRALPLPILALAVASFGIGTTEFVIMGLLPDVADSLGVGIPAAGYLVSAYALGVVVGAPLVAVATARLPRKTALLALVTSFTLGNVMCALAPSYALLMAARVWTAFSHGAFFGIGAVVASSLVPRDRRTRAVSLLFAGLTVANILGVPFGTVLGQALGWRATFWAVAAIGVVAWAAVAGFVPGGMPGVHGRLLAEAAVLRRPAVLKPMLLSVLGSVSMFSLFTYVAPFLEEVSGVTPHGVAQVLLAVGCGITAGNLVGGRLADRSLVGTVLGAFCGITAALLLLAVMGPWPAVAVPLLVVWGAMTFALGAPLQVWSMEAAADAPNLVSILNQGAFNLGNATGAWLGGLALTMGMDYARLPIIGAAVALLAAALCLPELARTCGTQPRCPAVAIVRRESSQNSCSPMIYPLWL